MDKQMLEKMRGVFEDNDPITLGSLSCHTGDLLRHGKLDEFKALCEEWGIEEGGTVILAR